MSEELFQAITALQTVLEKEASAQTTSVRLVFNVEGYEINYRTRTPQSLLADGISMRNIRGEWIGAGQ